MVKNEKLFEYEIDFFFFNIYSFCILRYPYYKDSNLNFLLSLSTVYHLSQISKSI